MRVFITGANGFIGFAVTQELLAAGHQVVGLTRSQAGALAAAGAQVLRGELDNLESLRTGAAQADAVIHTAFNHDFTKFAANCEQDRIAIETLGSALAGSTRPLIVNSGTGTLAAGRTATEDDLPTPPSANIPRVSEQTASSIAERHQIPTVVVRLPQVHDRNKQGLVSYLIAIAREKGISAYIGDGLNRWPAVHRRDAARLYRLALEKTASGPHSAQHSTIVRYHAVAEEGVPLREIAESIGRGLKLPVASKSREEAANHFGFLGFLGSRDLPASSAFTQQRLGWSPTAQSGLIEDLNHASAFA